jgi:hypothetical protein
LQLDKGGKKHKKDVESGGLTVDALKVPDQTNMQAASAFMTKMLLIFGLGRGNWNVGNNTQLVAARKRLAPSYATTVRVAMPQLAAFDPAAGKV